MRLAISGAEGFLGWHLRVRLRAEHQVEAVTLTRREFASPKVLAGALEGVDCVVHLAGVNRAVSDEAVEEENVRIAKTLADALSGIDRSVHVVYGNSIQSRSDNPYGRGKRIAGKILAQASSEAGGTFANVLLPNLFGEHGRPGYNSFVATFCHEVANCRLPEMAGDRPVPLLHAQGAAAILLEAASRRESHEVVPVTSEHLVSDIFARIIGFHEKYKDGQIPGLPDQFAVDLFNTYRSYMFPQHFPFNAMVNRDQRGDLFETVRNHGGPGQTFVSTTAPGFTRGDHFHLSKVERFFVIAGSAEIALRRVYNDEVLHFRVDGGDRCFVDMPTMWVHNITNVGDEDLVTMFWTNQLLDAAAPDTYWEPVESREGSSR